MRKYPYNYGTWPRDPGGNPIFTCTEQAIYYAHLCSHEISEVDRLAYLRKKAYQDIASIRAGPDPNYQIMMDLAFRAQLYRECLEEIARINDSKYEL